MTFGAGKNAGMVFLSPIQHNQLLAAASHFAAEDLYDQWQPLAFKLAGRQHARTGRELDECREIALDALWRAARGFRPCRGFAFGSYYGVALERMYHRAGQPLPTLEQIEIAAPCCEDEDFSPAMDRAWKHLTPCQQHVLELTVIKGYELAEVAREMGLTGSRVAQIRDESLAEARRLLEHPEVATQGELAYGEAS